MYIKNRYLSAIYKIALAACGIVGIQMQLSLFSGAANWGMFRYFTNLSNLLCVLYFLCAAVFLLTDKKRRSVFCPMLKSMVTMSITVTMLVAHFMLGNFTMNGTISPALLLLHYIVPSMTLLDWLLFDEKGLTKKLYPILGVIIPFVYFGYALIAAQTGTYQNGSRYPYPFIDVDNLGVLKVSLTVAALAAGFILLGYLFFLIDHGLARLYQNRKKPKTVS